MLEVATAAQSFRFPQHSPSPLLTIEDLSPPPEVEAIRNRRGRTFWVLREDKLVGGTKQRAARHYVADQKARGVEEFCYASPFAGFAQVALAVCCQTLGVRCRIFAEEDRTVNGRGAHAFTQLARAWGATVHVFPNLNSADRAAHAFSSARAGTLKIPLGFDCPSYIRYFREEVDRLWTQITAQTGEAPKRVWLPVGSGTLTRTVRAALPSSIRLECVNVRVLRSDDARISGLRSLPNTELRTVPENFADAPGVKAPLPSNHHYDAKLWRYLRTEARGGDLWWNVAR